MSDVEESTFPDDGYAPASRRALSRELPPVGEPSSSPRGTRSARSPRRSRQASLFAGFHGSDNSKVTALVAALGELWSSPSAIPGHFIDLGCGDGRVVMEVARVFPERHPIGVDLQPSLVDQAKATAKQQRLSGHCTFYAGDLATVDLSEASVVFLYFPPMALPALLTVLCKSNLRNGATVVSADGAWKSRESHHPTVSRMAAWEHSHAELLELLQPNRHCWGTANLYFYTWRGNTMGCLEDSVATEAKATLAEASVKAAGARVTVRLQAARALAEARQAKANAAAEAKWEQLRQSTNAAMHSQRPTTPWSQPQNQKRKKQQRKPSEAQTVEQMTRKLSPYIQGQPRPRPRTGPMVLRDGLMCADRTELVRLRMPLAQHPFVAEQVLLQHHFEQHPFVGVTLERLRFR